MLRSIAPVFLCRLYCLFYIHIFSKLPLYIKVLNLEIIGAGIVLMCAGTYSAFYTLLDGNSLLPPCYLNITAADAVAS